jgi:hypothetical protein
MPRDFNKLNFVVYIIYIAKLLCCRFFPYWIQMQGEIILSMSPSDTQMIDTANGPLLSFVSGELSNFSNFNMLFYML